jgi:3-hydroxyacyl-CoA dehydrogenase/enoyl-CoA hydratase/3-hydroxybutyryl-CoA epimerase/enoyl-CoA isomerase
MYKGNTLTVSAIEPGLYELCFDNQSDSVNKFDAATITELAEAGALLKDSGAKGLLVTSGKPVFVVGADITEFKGNFALDDAAFTANLDGANACFNQLEDLPMPTVCAINGFALGGGLEVTLACDFRVMSTVAKVGLPETKLGIFPGFGGTVRMPRLVGADNAIEWIAGGKEYRADVALATGVVDAVVAPENLRESSLNLLKQVVSGEIAYEARREQKKAPLQLNDIEMLMSFFTCKAMVQQQAGRNYPSPVAAIEAMEQSAKLGRDDALKLETQHFIRMARTFQSKALIGIFLNDQLVSKKAKTIAKGAPDVKQAAVLGAGIMGGGIAYQSALKGTPIVMKDINQAGIDLGLSEASKLLSKRVKRGRMTADKMAEVLSRINPALSYEELSDVDMIVEAVVENPKVKHAVLKEVETKVAADTIITSNTSTISIDYLAEALERPENFCGMHFFNPVPLMPLVEVIRGAKTSDTAVAKTVAYANALGKKAIVVNDCPGFFVNRVLFPYFGGFALLLRDGADFAAVDKVMERWGWPMGPAYLSDVVGLDTAAHAADVLEAGFPDRMAQFEGLATNVLFKAGRYGQKNGKGFYNYEADKRGKVQKVATTESYELIAPHCAERTEFEADDVIARMMVPMVIEVQRCLEEGIIASAAEADMALVYGVGFPPFRGGVFRYVDEMGMANFVTMADSLKHLGAPYEVTDKMREMAANGESYYG